VLRRTRRQRLLISMPPLTGLATFQRDYSIPTLSKLEIDHHGDLGFALCCAEGLCPSGPISAICPFLRRWKAGPSRRRKTGWWMGSLDGKTQKL